MNLKTAAVTLSVLIAAGCASYDPPESEQLGSLSMGLALDAEALSADDVAGFLMEVHDEDGLVEARYVPLEGEALPGHILPGAGDNHAFSDGYFLLEPGLYQLVATPMQDEETPSMVCEPAYGEEIVEPNQTVEVILISQCDSQDTGGLDIVGVLNHEPVIVSVTYEPSKFVNMCEAACITVVAEDVDNDPLAYEFELVGAPPGAEPTMETEDNIVCMTGRTAGAYQIGVNVEDGQGADTSLLLPVHVSAEPAGLTYRVGDGEPICLESFVNDLDAATFYRYGDPDGASANTGEGFERSGRVTLFIHEGAGGDLGLFAIFDEPGDCSGGDVTLSIDAAPGMQVLVKDDPIDFGDDPGEPDQLDPEGNATFHWYWYSCCTDGGVIGTFAPGDCIRLDFLEVEGVDLIDIVSGNDKITTTYDDFSEPITFCLGD